MTGGARKFIYQHENFLFSHRRNAHKFFCTNISTNKVNQSKKTRSYLINGWVVLIRWLRGRKHLRFLPSPIKEGPVWATALCHKVLGIGGECNTHILRRLAVWGGEDFSLTQGMKIVHWYCGLLAFLCYCHVSVMKRIWTLHAQAFSNFRIMSFWGHLRFLIVFINSGFRICVKMRKNLYE